MKLIEVLKENLGVMAFRLIGQMTARIHAKRFEICLYQLLILLAPTTADSPDYFVQNYNFTAYLPVLSYSTFALNWYRSGAICT